MTMYEARFFQTITLEAENQGEAEEKAYNFLCEMRPSEFEVEVEEVEE